MGYGTDGLTFNALREANVKRLPLFRNNLGEPAHSKPDGSDWSDAEWLQAVVGELGEYANLKKKQQRGDLEERTPEQQKEMLADELADVAIYLDLLCFRQGIDLGDAVMRKWNKTCVKTGVNMFLASDGWHLRQAAAPNGVEERLEPER